MFHNPRLRIASIQHGNVTARMAVIHQRFDFIHHPLRFEQIGSLLAYAYQFTFALLGPEVLAQPRGIVGNKRIGGIKNMAMRAIILLEPNDIAFGVIALECGHIADIGTAKRINGLVIVAHGK